MDGKTFALVVNKTGAERIVVELVQASAAYEVDPLPFDNYEIRVRDGREAFLRSRAEGFPPNAETDDEDEFAPPKLECSCAEPDPARNTARCEACGFEWCAVCHPTPAARCWNEINHEGDDDEEEDVPPARWEPAGDGVQRLAVPGGHLYLVSRDVWGALTFAPGPR